MSFDDAIRLTEILLGFAFMQQSLEHLWLKTLRSLFGARIMLSILLIFGIYTPVVCIGLCIISIVMLHRYAGPYNGGSDRMSLLVLFCLTAAHILPPQFQQYALGYLALQLVLSYGIAGWVKLKNPDWRSGRALQDVFQFSAYPVSESLRGWAARPRTLFAMSWAVIGFEMLFPLALLSMPSLIAALCIAATFHLANACLFGLNRFFWVWVAAYPSIMWLQAIVS